MFWQRVRLALSIRGSLVAKTPITGTLGVPFLIFGKRTASTLFAIPDTPLSPINYYRRSAVRVAALTNYQLPINQLPITNYQLPITNYQSPITN
jgi:hypothetical protein